MVRNKNAPTMADVAREAGVALGTVSRVVNGQQVGAEFRQKVEAAIERLGYRYNTSGRALRTDTTNTVALIIPNTVNPFFGLLVHHINMALEKRDYRMLPASPSTTGTGRRNISTWSSRTGWTASSP